MDESENKCDVIGGGMMVAEEVQVDEETMESLRQKLRHLEEEVALLRGQEKREMRHVACQTGGISVLDDFSVDKDGREEGYSIADMLKETSEAAMSSTGYSYDQRTGLYFYQESGCYYDPKTQLFFKPDTGCYYSYDSVDQQYKFHSRENLEVLAEYRQELDRVQGLQHKRPPGVSVTGGARDEAPSVRLMDLDTSQLSIVACPGDTISTDLGINPALLLDSSLLPECTLKVEFHEETATFRICLTTVECRAVCCLNKAGLTEQSWRDLHHLDRLSIGEGALCREFCVHIHDEGGTCNSCEPGVVRGSQAAEDPKTAAVAANDESPAFAMVARRAVIARLKVKYGLSGSRTHRRSQLRYSTDNELKSTYIDRAAIRRHQEKDEAKKLRRQLREAGVPQPGTNAAQNMMQKMGWNPGEALGKTGEGISEPIAVYQRLNGRAGIGSADSLSVAIDTDPKLAAKIRAQQRTRSRYLALSQTTAPPRSK